jgi:hypothetical protein
MVGCLKCRRARKMAESSTRAVLLKSWIGNAFIRGGRITRVKSRRRQDPIGSESQNQLSLRSETDALQCTVGENIASTLDDCVVGTQFIAILANVSHFIVCFVHSDNFVYITY